VLLENKVKLFGGCAVHARAFHAAARQIFDLSQGLILVYTEISLFGADLFMITTLSFFVKNYAHSAKARKNDFKFSTAFKIFYLFTLSIPKDS
jgi:hypothetical protein